jgi:nucleoside-diphosphate-sugar epimerase
VSCKRILVTGADGFFGRHFVLRLEETADVFLHCGRTESVDEYRTQGFVNVFCGDLAGDGCSCGFPDCEIDVVVHLAGLPGGEEPDLMRANVAVTKNMLSWAVEHGVRKVVFASTAAVYGDTCDAPASEMHALDPQSPYALSKARAEALLQEYAEGGGAVASLRIPHAYGPGKRVGILAAIVTHATTDGVVTLNGDGDEKRDFVYIDDVVAALVAAANADLSAGFYAYNIGFGQSLSLREACRVVAEVKGIELRVNLSGQPAGKPHCIQLDASKAKCELGWVPEVSLKQGVQLMNEPLGRRCVLGDGGKQCPL